MDTPRPTDPEIEILHDFERQDREDTRSLRWSLLGALAVHALILMLALPAAEEVGGWEVWACGIAPSREMFARPAAPRAALNVVPPPAVPVCGLEYDPSHLGTEQAVLVAELEMELSPPADSPRWARDFGETPRLIACVEPKWTEISRRARIQGTVILDILIREDGSVADPKILKSLPLGLGEAALHAVGKWRYEPIHVDGVPIGVRHLVSVPFKRGESVCPADLLAVLVPGL